MGKDIAQQAARPRAPARGGRHSSIREMRREQLIRSTIESIARRGFAETTLANVADGAGLSRGIVNFHFDTKEALLEDTLRYLANEYRAAWQRALARAGPAPAQRLHALLMADFEPAVCNRKKIAVWFAFWGESKSRPTYLRHCGAWDQEYIDVLAGLCAAIIEEGAYRGVQARLAATGIAALTDGLWLDLLLDPASFSRDTAREICMTFVAGLFPRHFGGQDVKAG